MKNKLWISAIALPLLFVACEKKTETEKRVDAVQKEFDKAVDQAVDSGNLTPEQKKQLEEAKKQMENLTDEQKQAIADAHKQLENMSDEQKKQLEEIQKQTQEALKNAGSDPAAAEKAMKEAQEKAAKALQGQ